MTSDTVKRNIFFVIAISAVVVLVVLFSTVMLDNGQFTAFTGNDSYQTLDEWQMNDSETIVLPYNVKGTANKAITIKTILGEINDNGLSVMYMSNYCISRVYLDGDEIGSYGTEKPSPFGYMLGNIRVLVPLPDGACGKELKIEITPVYTQNYELPMVMTGHPAALRHLVLKKNIWRIFVCCFLFTIFLLSFVFASFQTFSKAFHSNLSMFWYFSGFVLSVIIWLICSSDIPQFFTSKNESVALISYMSLAAMGVPYIGYCRHIFSSGKKLLMRIEMFGYFIPVTVAVAFVTNLADPPQLLVITHLNMALVVISSFYMAVSEWKTNRDSRIMVFSMIFLMSSAFIGLVCYYTRPTSGLDAVAFGGGFLIFMFFLLSILVMREVSYIRERMSMDIYREMAYTDKLTGCGNRAALDAEIELAESDSGSKYRWITVLMIDLNHLKQVNDNLGHEAGDELIRGCAWCLQEAFSGTGSVFRLGGDEFTVLLWNEKYNMNRLLEKLGEAMDIYNSDHENKVSMAKGYAECEWTAGKGLFQKVFRKADEFMYEDKERCHEADRKALSII